MAGYQIDRLFSGNNLASIAELAQEHDSVYKQRPPDPELIKYWNKVNKPALIRLLRQRHALKESPSEQLQNHLFFIVNYLLDVDLIKSSTSMSRLDIYLSATKLSNFILEEYSELARLNERALAETPLINAWIPLVKILKEKFDHVYSINGKARLVVTAPFNKKYFSLYAAFQEIFQEKAQLLANISRSDFITDLQKVRENLEVAMRFLMVLTYQEALTLHFLNQY